MVDALAELNDSRRKLRDRYLRTFPEKCARLREVQRLLDAGDPAGAERCARLCHQLAGSGSMYGFSEITELAREAEDLAASDPRPALAKLIACLETLRGEHLLPAPPAESGEGVSPSAGPLVYLADDDADVRTAFEAGLSAAGFVAKAFEDGQALLDALGDARVQAFVLDWEMPRLDGMQTIDALRGRPEYRAAPIVMVSSKSASRHALEVLGRGGDAFIEKPCEPDSLAARLRDLIGAPG